MTKQLKPVIAVFDFDDTLIRTDSLPDFLLHSFSVPTVAAKALQFTPVGIRYVLHSITNSQAKERLLTLFLAGLPEKDFLRICSEYADRLQMLENPTALARLKWHQAQGHRVIIISASAGAWIRPWARRQGVGEVIATELEIKAQTLTGRLHTPNCHGPEKVKRFLETYPHRTRYTLYVYGDGKSDKEILDLADHSFLGRFS